MSRAPANILAAYGLAIAEHVLSVSIGRRQVRKSSSSERRSQASGPGHLPDAR